MGRNPHEEKEMNCAYCRVPLNNGSAYYGFCKKCFDDAMTNLKGQPDHDAEILGYPDGEAPTLTSRMWLLANPKEKK